MTKYVWDDHFTFFDMSTMSKVSSSGHPEMCTVDSGSEASLPLKEHRVAWKLLECGTRASEDQGQCIYFDLQKLLMIKRTIMTILTILTPNTQLLEN